MREMDADRDELALPDMKLAQLYYVVLGKGSRGDDSAAKAYLEQEVLAHKKSGFGRMFLSALSNQITANQLEEWRKEEEERIIQLNEVITHAEQEEGESEVRLGYLNRADYYCERGLFAEAHEHYEEALTKTVALSQKLDIVMKQLRMALFTMEHEQIKGLLKKVQGMVEAGGDWDRRNRVKIYEACYLCHQRNFEGAAALLVPGVSTFAAVEIFDYETFVVHLIVVCMVALDRVNVKEKVIDNGNVLAQLKDTPLHTCIMAFYDSDYKAFIQSLPAIADIMAQQRFLGNHVQYFLREMRIAAYRQLMISYRSVKLDKMAQDFGLSVEFLDKDLSRFIASGRLNCTIDKVSGTIFSTSPEEMSASYHEVMKVGDELINRVSRLSSLVYSGI